MVTSIRASPQRGLQCMSILIKKQIYNFPKVRNFREVEFSIAPYLPLYRTTTKVLPASTCPPADHFSR